MYNERKLKQSGRQYSYLSNSSRKNFTFMNLSESTKRQGGIGTSGRRYDRFGNLITASNDGAQKSAQLSTNAKAKEPTESPLSKKEELPKEEEEKEKVIIVTQKDLDDEEVPIEVEKKKKSKEGHKKHKHKTHISDEDEEIEVKVEEEKENEENEVSVEIEKEETQIETNEIESGTEEEKEIQTKTKEKDDEAEEEKPIPSTEIEADEEKPIPPTEAEEAEEEKPIPPTETEEDEEKPIPPTEIEDETQDEHKSDSEEKKKKKKRKERKSVNIDEVQEEKVSNDEEKKKKHKKKRSTSISAEAVIAEQEPPTFTPEIEDEAAEKESHKKSKKRRSRSRSCGKTEEKEEEKEKEEKEDKDEEGKEELPLVLEEVTTTEEAKDEDKKKRRHHSKSKSRDESDGHHHHKKRSSSVSKEKEVGDGDDDGEKEGGSEERDKKRKRRKSATAVHENTRKLSLGDGDEKIAPGLTGNTNESWKKKKAWATLGANDVNKPFGEMTADDKAIMREKYETEIVETESDYIDKLKLIKELYMAPLVALTKTGNEKSAIITTTQISHIFSNLDIILNYNAILYKQMREWKEKVDEEKAAAAAASASKKKKKDKSPARRDSEGGCPRAKSLGTIFLTLTDFLKTYISYCNNYPRALETISELKEKNKRFVDFINECQLNERSESLNLNMLIIMPIQRIPRYVLLLKDVLKYTPEDDPDYEKLTRALDKMRAVADDLNKKKKDAEDRDLLRHIDKKLIFNSNGNYGDFDSLLSVQSRRYIGEGDGTVICSTVEKGKPKGMHIFLFNDIVCFTKPSISGGKYKVIELFKIIDSEITMLSPAEARKEIPALPAAVSSALPVEELICFSSADDEEDGSSIKPFAFYAEDGATTKKWFDDLVSNQEIIRKSAQTFKDAVVRASITPTLPQKITLN